MEPTPAPGLCGCCTPAASPTPLVVDNLPGLSAVAYRIGTYSSFREAMVRALAQQPALAGLTVRTDDDPAIALLDLWAAVGDVLTFYQERIANEAWLRTAVQRDSVLRLVRLLDYQLRPGLAATTRLAFTAETGATVAIPVGLRVMSTPAQDQMPQVFETVEAIVADSRLNSLPVLPPPLAVNPLAQGRQTAFLTADAAGWQAAQGLQPQDTVVLFGGSVATPGAGPTVRTLGEVMGLRVPPRVPAPAAAGGPPADVAAQVELWAAQAAPAWSAPAAAATPAAPEEKVIQEVRVDGDRFVLVWTRPVVQNGWTAATTARVYRRKMRLFGHDAADFYFTVVPGTTTQTGPTWASQQFDFVIDPTSDPGPLALDRVYADLAAGDELMLYEAGNDAMPMVVQVTGATQGEAVLKPAPPANCISDQRPRGTVSLASLSTAPKINDLRQVEVYQLDGPAIPLWGGDFPDLLTGGSVVVPAVRLTADGSVVEIGRTIAGRNLVPGVAIRPTDVAPGREVLLVDLGGVPVPATVTACTLETFVGEGAGATGDGQDFLRIDLATLSPLVLEAQSAVMLGNVAAATHGQTVPGEILGDGNASSAFQRFTLRKQPLTYVPSAQTVRGLSTLSLLAGGVQWTEVPSLFGQPATAAVYTARQNDDGTTVVQFGDGATGARLPSGRGNVTATYRQGSGLAGRLAAQQLNILLDRPVGLKAAANPAPTEGGADPETLDGARQAAPATVMTFGRAVALPDFALLALTSGEIAKALATWAWDGLEKGVHLTVAGQLGGTFSPDDLQRLYSALTQQRDPNHPLVLANVSRIPIVVNAAITVADDVVQADVLAAALAALLGAFAFDAVAFAAPVHLSDLYAVLQGVPGVSHLEIGLLHFKGFAAWTAAQLAARDATADPVQPHLRLFGARPLAGSSAANDPFVNQLFGGSPPAVLPAEQAYVQDPPHDAVITAVGGLS